MIQIGSQSGCQFQVEANGPQSSGCASNDPRSLHRVAQEFESLLIEQILSSMKLGKAGEDGDSCNSSMMDFAQQNLARLISQRGGIGVGHFLESALNKTDATSSVSAASSSDSVASSLP